MWRRLFIKSNHNQGSILAMILVTVSIFFIFAIAILDWSLTERKNTLLALRKTQALQVAEAGVGYYQWHLNHADSDFMDGNDWCCDNDNNKTLTDCGGVCGPYVHIYKDYNNIAVGEYSLRITPPTAGVGVVGVESTGVVYSDTTVKQKVMVRLGKMSLARFSFLSNAPIWVGSSEHTRGPVHSNDGIRFDGTCDAEVTSAKLSYGPLPSHNFNTGTRSGVWGSTNPEVKKYWLFPEPVFDFGLLTMDMAVLKNKAQAPGGLYLSGSLLGYRVVFKNNSTITIYKVLQLSPSVRYYNDDGLSVMDYERIHTESLLGTYDMPSNGVIFADNTVWVEGTVSGRVTLAVSNFATNPSNYARIIINNNIVYTAHNDVNALGLMSEGDILVPRHAPDILNIDAVLLSQKGHVYRRNYVGSYRKVQNSINVYGGIITNYFWTWGWVNSSNVITDGYRNTNTVYDNNLIYSPPPFFPTEGNFKIISWQSDK